MMTDFLYSLSSGKERVMDFIYGLLGDVWRWFSLLNREEWMVVLAIGASLGFLCMRGFGSRSKY